ncbi:MAG: HAD-IA family hydrolase [Chloroflexi bacterium]|nr:HAD-IA family hydrolase [Chloroflexota bacterium]
MIRNLIWDVDGTIFDTYPAMARAFGAALNDLGAEAPLERIESLARQRVSHCAATLAREADVSLEDLRDGFARRFKSTRPQVQVPFPGVVEVCEYACSIGGTNVIITHRGRESTLQLLAAHEMGAYFADILTRGDGYPRKPDPAIYEAMIERHGFGREETLAIGDRDIDVLAGQAAGVRTCLFGSASDEVAADFTIADYAELRQILVAERD